MVTCGKNADQNYTQEAEGPHNTLFQLKSCQIAFEKALTSE